MMLHGALCSRYRWWTGALAALGELDAWQRLPAEETTRLQQRRVTRLVQHAVTHVPYYQKTLSGILRLQNSGHVEPACWSDLPLLDKDILRENFDQLRSAEHPADRLRRNASGGSTGEPAEFLQDDEYARWTAAAKLLFDRWTGYEEGQPRIFLWGSERDVLHGRVGWRTSLVRWVFNARWLNMFHVTPAQISGFVREINEFRPIQITAYAQSAFEVARYASGVGLKLHSPRAVLTSAQILHPHMRETIQRAFGCPVFDRYGSREVGDVACECEEHRGLHVCMPTHLVEILRPDGAPAEKGEIGEVVITLLTNFAMPLIRYRIGDRAAWATQSCSCGRNWPLLSRVVGRMTDTFIGADGSWVDGEYFTHLFYGLPWVQQFQVVQEQLDRVRVSIVPRKSDGGEFLGQSALEHELTTKIRHVLGANCRVDVLTVPDIPPSPSGKHRFTISHVKAS